MPFRTYCEVGIKFDVAGPLQGLKRHDRGHQLHAVIGCVRFPAPKLALAPAEHQERPPAAGARIALAAAVGVDGHGARPCLRVPARSHRRRASVHPDEI